MFLTEKRKKLSPLSSLQCHVITLCDLEFMKHISLFFLLFCLLVHHPCIKKIPWRRKWLPTLVSLPGEFQGQKSMASYSPSGLKQSDLTQQHTHTHTHKSIITSTVETKVTAMLESEILSLFPDSFKIRTKATAIRANISWENTTC